MDFWMVTQRLLEGFLVNCEIFLITLVCALPLGLLVAFGSMSKIRPLSWLVRSLVWVIRGTPLMLQIIAIFYGPGLLWGARPQDELTAVCIAFVINYAAYFSEIFRGGIQAIPKGQYEAGQVLGLTSRQIFFKIVLLQVVKRIVPPMSNEIITLVKDTALARVIACKELLMMAQEFVNVNGMIWPLFYTAIFYLIFCGGLTLLFGALERKLDYFRV